MKPEEFWATYSGMIVFNFFLNVAVHGWEPRYNATIALVAGSITYGVAAWGLSRFGHEQEKP